MDSGRVSVLTRMNARKAPGSKIFSNGLLLARDDDSSRLEHAPAIPRTRATATMEFNKRFTPTNESRSVQELSLLKTIDQSDHHGCLLGIDLMFHSRSEERRVGKECRS